MTENSLTLGVTWGTHDSSAALFSGNHLVGFVEEERLTGNKHSGELPREAIAALLGEVGASPGDVDTVAFAFRARGYAAGFARASRQALLAPLQRRMWARMASYASVYQHTRGRLRLLSDRFSKAKLVEAPHHLCHSLYAQAAAGQERVAALVIDSIGEWRTTSIIEGQGLTQRTLLHQADPHSLGYAYGAVTEHLGYKRGDGEGTVMALAAMGDPERYRPLFEEAIEIRPEGFRLNTDLFAIRVFSSSWQRLTDRFVAATAAKRAPTEPVEPVHADIAAALQARVEEVVVHLARLAAERTGADTLCVSGGVAMNCLAMAAIGRSGLFERIVVPPAPGDGGTSIGAALAQLDAEALSDSRLKRWDLGPRCSEAAMKAAAAGCRFRVTAPPDPTAKVLEELLAGRVVGVFHGRMEAGPRALGHRSILASPLAPEIAARLSARVKLREPFRPFAPVLPRDAVDDYFLAPDPSPYMSFAFPARPRARQEVPAVVHRNGTARVQSLSPEEDPFVHDLLERFGMRSGVPVLINTSLNVRGAAMAGTPQAAIECMEACELDGLMMGDRYLER